MKVAYQIPLISQVTSFAAFALIVLSLSFLTLALIQKVEAQEAGLTITGVEVQQVTPDNLEATSNVISQEEDFVTVSMEPIVHINFRSLYSNFPWGSLSLSAIPFDIPEIRNGASSNHGLVKTMTLPTNPTQVKSVYLLINSWDTWIPYNNLRLGEVSINFEDNTNQKTDLIIGQNIREWRHGNDIFPTVNTTTSQNSTEVFRGNPSSLAGPAVLDMLKIDINQENQNKKVTSISVTDSLVEVLHEGNPATDPNLFWAGLTLEKTGPESLPVPYFSQNDPQWGSQEYDHANSLNLDCGTTMAQCGCATTSAAMILKYYGVDKSPTGEPTSPETLNNWLNGNQGYTFGNVRWPSIATYSFNANENYGTPKIKFVGFAEGNDFNTLNNELNNEKPVILQEPGHFIVATGISGSTYSINDPHTTAKTTLGSFGNSFENMRLYEPTNTDLSTIYITAPTPTEIFLIDSLGRRVGKDPITGITYNEIPNSFYFIEQNLIDDTSNTGAAEGGVTMLAIINPDLGSYEITTFNSSGNYELSFAGYDKNGNISTFDYIGSNNRFNLNFSPNPGAEINVEQIVDIDIKPGSDPNSVNLSNRGVIPVAILTTPRFDATQVDTAAIRFGPNQAKETHNKGHFEDVDSDGDIDLVLHFKNQELGLKNTDIEVCSSGFTIDNSPFFGCDEIKIVQSL